MQQQMRAMLQKIHAKHAEFSAAKEFSRKQNFLRMPHRAAVMESRPQKRVGKFRAEAL